MCWQASRKACAGRFSNNALHVNALVQLVLLIVPKALYYYIRCPFSHRTVLGYSVAVIGMAFGTPYMRIMFSTCVEYSILYSTVQYTHTNSTGHLLDVLRNDARVVVVGDALGWNKVSPSDGMVALASCRGAALPAVAFLYHQLS